MFTLLICKQKFEKAAYENEYFCHCFFLFFGSVWFSLLDKPENWNFSFIPSYLRKTNKSMLGICLSALQQLTFAQMGQILSKDKDNVDLACLHETYHDILTCII